jgi:hypothetical protein
MGRVLEPGKSKHMKSGHPAGRRPLCLSLALLFIFLSASANASWTPELIPAKDHSYRLPSEEIRLYIPPEVPLEVLQNLSLELDDIDVTALVGRDGDFALFVPIQPLSYGQHRLRLVENAADGSILERGFWTLDVRKSESFREADLNIAASVEFSRRVGEKNMAALPSRRTQGTGSAAIQGRLADSDWQAGLHLPLFYNSNTEGREIEAGEFLLDWQRKSLSAKVGHHPIAPDSLVMSGFNRRGVSATYASSLYATRMTGFSMRGSQVSGFQHGMGVGERTDQVQGGVITAFPINRADAGMALSAIYLSGEAPDTGLGVAGDPFSSGGDAWSIGADGSWLDRRIRLRGEYASTAYDFDGSGSNGAEKDNGYSLLMTYKPWSQKQMGEHYLDWNMGAEYKQVGTYFKSVANPGATADRKMGRLFSDISWGGLGVQAQLAQETDNVADLVTLPRLRTRLASISTSYTPTPEYTTEGEWVTGWLGHPSYSLFGNLQRSQTITRAALDPNTYLDTQTKILGATANFSHTNWSWGINHTWTRVEDDSLQSGTPTTNESQTRSTGLDFVFNLTPDYTFSPHLSWDETNYLDLGYTDKALFWGVSLDARFIPERLTGRFDYSMNRSWVTNDSLDNTTDQFSANLTWIAVKANPSRPGVSFTLSGDYRDYKDSIVVGNDNQGYQLFLRTLIGWSGSY